MAHLRSIVRGLSIVVLLPFFLHGRDTANDRRPSRIVLNGTETPATAMAVTWWTAVPVHSPGIQYGIAPSGPIPVDGFTTLRAAAVRTLAAAAGVHYSALLSPLIPGKRYVYRVGGDSAWSEWSQFSTAKDTVHPFSFLWLGDVQHGLRSEYPRVIREAYRTEPRAAFLLFSGDLTDRPQYDEQWRDLFAAADFIHRSIPSVMVPGNHEFGEKDPNGTERWRDRIHPSWNAHFTLPKNGPAGSEGCVFTFVYQGVRFVMLNGTTQRAEQTVWLDSVLSADSSRWKIVTVHQPLFSMGKGRDQRGTRDAFLTLFDRHGVDIVLSGHDHVYTRSQRLRNGRHANAGEKGTLYLTAVAGSDAYRLNTDRNDIMAAMATHVQTFQLFRIAPDTIALTAFCADGTVLDVVTLHH